MEKIDFQRQILSQIRMSDLRDSLLSYENNRGLATSMADYTLATSVLNDANDSNALKLMSELLDNAKIPTEILDVMRLYTVLGTKLSKNTWDYFYNYRFTGKIETSFTVDLRRFAPGAKPLFLIMAEDAIVDILQAPLNMLLGFIEHISRHWKNMSRLGAQTYFLHGHHSDLFVYIEGHIAEYYGAMHAFDGGVVTEKINVFNGYRFVGAINQYPFDDKLINIARDAAIHQAKSTNS